ncbi:MAG: hypothetical protein DDT19_01132 [Syntrophomonadaceae bacterium]|nr:hypothetical protein [Bacillota bacterium]
MNNLTNSDILKEGIHHLHVFAGLVKDKMESRYEIAQKEYLDFLTSSYHAGYKAGCKDSEGTKNGAQRYQMGYEDGNRAGKKEVLNEMQDIADRTESEEVRLAVEQIKKARLPDNK